MSENTASVNGPCGVGPTVNTTLRDFTRATSAEKSETSNTASGRTAIRRLAS